MATAAQIENRVFSTTLLNVAGGLISSMVIYVSFTETRDRGELAFPRGLDIPQWAHI
jgi:hypothetical protein